MPFYDKFKFSVQKLHFLSRFWHGISNPRGMKSLPIRYSDGTSVLSGDFSTSGFPNVHDAYHESVFSYHYESSFVDACFQIVTRQNTKLSYKRVTNAEDKKFPVMCYYAGMEDFQRLRD